MGNFVWFLFGVGSGMGLRELIVTWRYERRRKRWEKQMEDQDWDFVIK